MGCCYDMWALVCIIAGWQIGTIVQTDDDIDGLVQERRNSSALAVEFNLSCTNPSTWFTDAYMHQ